MSDPYYAELERRLTRQADKDAEIETENAERLRRSEIAALLVERGRLAERRLEIEKVKPTAALVCVPDPTVPVTGMRVEKQDAATRQKAILEAADRELGIIDRELAARGYENAA
jgi:hypothetical protein